ncbi:MAG: potassium transporter, partial [Muribaculaceae bacterium]|nr:potassium transporter [Muribaculaceae bacterium]
MDILTFVAAFLTIVSIIILAGYENDRPTLTILHRITRISHVVFIVNVLYNIIFTFKLSIRRTRRFRWILDLLVLSTLLPLIYPHPEHPWVPWLDLLLYSSWFNYGIVGIYALVIFCTGIVSVLGRRTNPSVILGSSFLFFILLGSFLLMMPRCTTVEISYVDSLFVSTSAVSITGLSPIDISETFTPLGLLILALLIQIGGLGVLTFTSFFALFFSGNTSIYSQLMVRDMVYTRTMNNLLPTLLYILVFTLSIELIGAVAIFI